MPRKVPVVPIGDRRFIPPFPMGGRAIATGPGSHRRWIKYDFINFDGTTRPGGEHVAEAWLELAKEPVDEYLPNILIEQSPQRIDIILEEIRRVWMEHPKCRFINLLSMVADRENGGTLSDAWHQEDEWVYYAFHNFPAQDKSEACLNRQWKTQDSSPILRLKPGVELDKLVDQIVPGLRNPSTDIAENYKLREQIAKWMHCWYTFKVAWHYPHPRETCRVTYVGVSAEEPSCLRPNWHITLAIAPGLEQQRGLNSPRIAECTAFCMLLLQIDKKVKENREKAIEMISPNWGELPEQNIAVECDTMNFV